MVVVKLKKLNRLDKIRLHSRRDSLQKEKQQVDSNRLKLQNLIYEAAHLKKEIQKCYSFKSEDEDIELVPVENFMEKAPEPSRTPEVIEDEHALRLARLEFELQQRKEYAQLCKELQSSKEEIAQSIITVKEKLNSLDPCLQEVRKATRPIQQILEMPFEKEWEIQKLVRLLPQPLYMAYSKLCAYSEVIDKKLTVSIEGDEDEARQLEIERRQTKVETENGADEDSENETEENDFDDTENRRKIQRRQSRTDNINQKREKLFKHHPLSVKFNITTKGRDEVLSITLIYLPQLNFVTVQCKFNFDNNQSIAAGDIITQDRILSSLYPEDFGIESPNPKTSYQLQNVHLEGKDLSKLLDDKMLGKPYKWAQRLCGLNFTSPLSPEESYKLCEETVPKLIRQMRKRLNARLKLFHQIQSLEIGKMTATGSAVKISNVLQQFVTLSFAEYEAVPCTRKFIDEGVINSNDLFYRAVLLRGSAKLECYIAVPGNFPNDLPVFAINFSWNDDKVNSETSSHLREIEFWVNSIATESIDNILPLQLQRAMTSFDIFLETESIQQLEISGAPEFQQEKNFTRCFRGRMRSRPYEAKQIGHTISYKHI